MNVIYFDNTARLVNNDIITLQRPVTNIYTYDYFNESARQNMINHLLGKIKNDNPIIVYSTCKTSVGSILYCYELSKLLTNEIYMCISSPLLTLKKQDFTDLSHFGSGHSIHSIFNTFKLNDAYVDIVNRVFQNDKIRKICFYSENDKTVPECFNSGIYANSKNLIVTKFLNSRLHNIYSLFYYGYSKNFEKFRKQNHYVPEDDLHTATRIWNDDIKLDTLTQSILSTDFSIFEKYDFMSISYYH
jgi:hypothetical protein